ncbi:MAG TPA: monovalent cation/H(+) antiporter subunit G [Gemmatimonadetes bacterium]|nr:monovalent cation/H(+) antiporter subunit G [Gemmatimonadota bacterium]
MTALLDVLSWISILGGFFFIVVGSIGVLRLPDVYTRLHAAGMTDTMGAGLVLIGMSFQAGLTLITVRLLLIWVFLLFTSPIGTHALARAALHGKVEPFRVEVAGGES